MVEDKESISVSEFKAWLVGLIRGKSGQLPNIEDWKEIKKMLDKVEEKSIFDTPIPNYPIYPTYPSFEEPKNEPYKITYDDHTYVTDHTFSGSLNTDFISGMSNIICGTD